MATETPAAAERHAEQRSVESVAIMNASGRVDKVTVPLATTDILTDIDPSGPRQYDAILIDTPDMNLGKAVLRGRLDDTPIVYRMRGDVFREMEMWEMAAWKRFAAERVMLPGVDGAITAGEYLADVYRQETGVSPVASIGMPVDLAEWPTVRHDSTDLRLVTLTNMNYAAKIEPLLSIAPVVDDVLRETGGRWRVCGRGEYSDRVRAGVAGYDNVEFAGYVDAADELARSNAMLHYSDLDGQPNAILEGMASNLPVVTNDFGAFRKFDGPLTITGSDGQLRTVLHRLTDPSHREALGKRGALFVADNHDPGVIGQQYVDYFDSLLSHE